MRDSEDGLIRRSLNDRLSPNTGNMILICKNKKNIQPGSQEPSWMIGPDCKYYFTWLIHI